MGAQPGAPAPPDLVLMAYVKEPHGLTGRVKLHAYSDQLDALADFGTWWMALPGVKNEWVAVEPEECVERGGSVIAKLPQANDRDAAAALKGARIAVARSDFPPSAEDEFYWADLIGLVVKNRSGETLGKVTDLMDLGPHQVLKVAAEKGEILIPFVAQYVDRVDIGAGVVEVDWGADY